MNSKTLLEILVSRNQLVEELLTELPSSDKAFKKGLALRSKNWEKDKEIYKNGADNE